MSKKNSRKFLELEKNLETILEKLKCSSKIQEKFWKNPGARKNSRRISEFKKKFKENRRKVLEQ